MAIIATGQISIVDLTDGKSLSCYITSNLPKTQIKDPNPGGSITPDWSGTPKLILTPVIFANQTALALNATGLTITWKRKEGSGGEAALASGESVSGGVLTVSANKLNGVASGLLTYLCYVTYVDPDNGLTINVVADITFSQIQTALNAESVWIAGEQLFKYDASSAVTPSQIELTANISNVSMSKWQYRDADGAWQDYPTTSDNASITSTTLIVKPTHAVFVGDGATLRAVTSNSAVFDVISIYKVRDGATGSTGSAAYSVFLTNENMTFAGNVSGQVAAVTKTCNVVAYVSGAWQTISGQTGSSLSVEGSTVDGVASFQCVMTYGGKTYTDTISLTDKTDNYQASIESSGGDVFKNSIGSSTLLCRLFQNGQEVDTDGSAHTYKWYRRDKDGNAMDSGGVFATGKSIAIDGDDVDVKTTFICEVT